MTADPTPAEGSSNASVTDAANLTGSSIVATTMLYVVGPESQVTEMSLQQLADAFRGGMEAEEIAVFLDRAAAERHADRRRLIVEGANLLSRLSNERLHEIVRSIKKECPG